MAKKLTKKELEQISHLLIYLDVKVNWNEDRYIGNDICHSMTLIMELEEKYPELSNPTTRHKLISKLLDRLEESANE